jgi:hypothetical protein
MDKEELIREAMREIGSRTSDRKARAARENGARNVVTDEKRARMKQGQIARRERERAQGLVGPPRNPDAPKRPRGRPRKEQAGDKGSD